jgi:GTP-binding protein
VIRDAESGEVLQDFMTDGQSWVACKGGRGGKGNAHFVSSTFQAPKFAQPGEEGESRAITLELKLLADVGIIGFPNAGKSTLISRISAARPKIADYAFTTRVPNLGVVAMPGPEGATFVVADIPGLIPGAHKGLGLGHKFLRHIERTRLFVHLLDGTQLLEDVTRPEYDDEGNLIEREDRHQKPVDQLLERYQAIRKELGLFNPKLLHKPEIVVINKVDTFGSDPALVERARTTLKQSIASIRGAHPVPGEPFFVSAVSGQGIEELIGRVYEELRAQAKKENNEGVKLPDDEDLRT